MAAERSVRGDRRGTQRRRTRFYRIARRSATECAAVLDISIRLELATAASCQPARELLLRIVSMLINMGRALHA
jgi:four helix bundle protein